MTTFQKKICSCKVIQIAFGLGAMSGPLMCSIFMDIVGINGFWMFLAIFHSLIEFLEYIELNKIRVQENSDSQFTAMPESITPVGMELNPQTEPLEEPIPTIQTTSDINKLIKNQQKKIKINFKNFSKLTLLKTSFLFSLSLLINMHL